MKVEGVGCLVDDTMFYAVRFPPSRLPITCAPVECAGIQDLIQQFYARAKNDYWTARNNAIAAANAVPGGETGAFHMAPGEYQVEKITTACYIDNVLMFRIYWTGHAQPTSEPLGHCLNAPQKVKEFFDRCEAIENTID
ncbi:hypothetical protein AAVH_12564 [Aphelenchoides avenae]|nr:hypothetical protein AAVH_12564 [Aphelenchus avenae]